MDEMFQGENSKSGYPEGFEGEIDNSTQNVMPTFEEKSPAKDINYKLIGIIAGSFFLLLTIVVICVTFIKPKSKLDENGYKAVAEGFVETIEKKEPKVFDEFIYPDEDIFKEYMKKVVKTFTDAENLSAEYDYDKTDKGWKAKIFLTYAIGIEEYETTATLDIVPKDGKWYLYGCKFSDIRKMNEEAASESDAETEEAVPARRFVTVGTDASGTFSVPDSFTLTSLNLPNTEGIAYEYTLSGNYNGFTEDVSVIVYSAPNSLQALAENLSNNILGTVGEVVVNEEREGEVYTQTVNDGGVVTELRTFLGGDNVCRSFVVRYSAEDTEMAGTWNSYSLPSGFLKEVKEEPIAEGMQRIGSEELGTIDISDKFVVDDTYTAEGLTSVGYTYEDATVVLMSYAGTDKESLPTKEFAENVRANLLGDKGSEFETGEWFYGAYYSYGVAKDGSMSEMYAFTGEDGVNRLLLLIHNQEDTETAAYYTSYRLAVGVRGIEE